MKRILAVTVAMLALVSAGPGLSACSSDGGGAGGGGEPLTIGKMPIEAHALVHIAEDQGIFARNGLNVTIRDYATGPAAMDGLLNGEVNVSHSGEFVAASTALRRADFVILAAIDRYQFFYLSGRKDRGISGPSDLRGKRIGATPRTNGEFFLGRFLRLQGISPQDVTFVDVQPTEFVDAITSGRVDAVVHTRTYADAIAEKLGGNIVSFSVQSLQDLYSVMVAKRDWVADHPGTVTRLLRSLAQAEQYLANNPSEAKSILQERLVLDASYIDGVWSDHRFSLSLEQSLIAAMEDEARWVIQNDPAAREDVPNFADYVYEDALKKVKPGAVNIIR